MADERSCGRRRRWAETEKRRIVAELEESGLPLGTVARRHNVSSSCLGRWRDKFGGLSASVSPPVFVPVEVAGPPVDAAKPSVAADRSEVVVEIILNGGRRLRVDADIAPARLRLLVAAVETA